MHGDLLLVVLILVLGCGAFVFGVLYVLFHGLAAVWRMLVGTVTGRPPGGVGRERSGGRMMVCTRPECRKVEHRPAVYCAACGALLRPAAGHEGR